MEIPEALADEVRRLEAERQRLIEQRNQVTAQYQETKRHYENVRERLTFRDKYLDGHFGGDVSRARTANMLSDKLDKLENQAEQHGDAISSLEQQIWSQIHEYLWDQDEGYQELIEQQEQLETVSQYLDDYRMAIDLALDAVADAKGAEGIDFFTDNLFVDAWSSGKNDVVEDAMDTVAQRREAFKQAVTAYEAVEVPDEEVAADLPSFASDIVLDLFSMDSIIAYGELDKASSTLKELEDEYEQFRDWIVQEYEETQTVRERRIKAVKTEILDGGERTRHGY